MIGLPYLLTLTAAAGIAIGGGGVWYVRGVEVGRLQNQVERLEGQIRLAAALAEGDARRAEGVIAGLQSDLARSRNEGERVYVETVKQVEGATSPRRQCLGPDAVGVLRHASSPAAEGPGPGVAPGASAALAPDPGGSAASEQAVALWMTAALRQYQDLRDRHRALAGVVRALPCVAVE